MSLHSEDRAGEPIHAPGGVVVTPQARAIRLELPGRHGGLIWNRPTAVKVRDAAGQESVLQVVDVTRQAQVSIVLSALLSTLLWMVIIWGARKLLGKR